MFKCPDEMASQTRCLLELLGHDLDSAAKECGMRPAKLDRILSGKKYLRRHAARKLNRAFGLYMDYLTGGYGFAFDNPKMNDVFLTEPLLTDEQRKMRLMEEKAIWDEKKGKR